MSAVHLVLWLTLFLTRRTVDRRSWPGACRLAWVPNLLARESFRGFTRRAA